ncbi:endolytic transglycosylase MltG [Nocardioides seonyuensis]|uniref:Endolytic murein transglycosylase n=1 Tax=Nocardioides seonyuensis TaxID=2518371 RepID=A0A4P7IIJ9_9ACTN|nr:endolytic transglycosylase MltG [Nocardioides seonyuensis]QBX57206.1 endolytic transglycosylase MltG [Nocardioides seonyuensis]
MSEQQDERDYEYIPGGARRKSRGYKGCLAVLVALAVLAGGFWLALDRGKAWVEDRFSGAEDFPGPGSGQVAFEVEQGDTTAQIGRNLKAEGVTASVEAFTEAAASEPKISGVQVGVYPLRKEMKASDVVEVLIDPANLQRYPTVTIPEGLRVTDIVARLAEETEFSEDQWNKALDSPKIGLPDYAQGNPEGYLFPATYEIKPGMKPVDVLKAMVDRWRQAAEDAGLEERAAELGRTPAEVMIIASLVEAEGRGDDMPKIARVIYNRLDGPGDKGGTNGLLQIDATVNYALDRQGIIAVTTDEIESVADSPYNTYKNVGLPPTPIEAPGEDAIEAAANPAEGPWYYYVTVDLKTGETKFAETYDEFLQYKAEYQAYCETSDAC